MTSQANTEVRAILADLEQYGIKVGIGSIKNYRTERLEKAEAAILAWHTQEIERIKYELGVDIESFGAIPVERVREVLNRAQLNREEESNE